jgi:4-cresol dehydrogenase (hydroxylating)
MIASARAVADLNMGRPNPSFLAGAYWRRRDGMPASLPGGLDPARDRCGMMWLSPVLPMTSDAVCDFLARIEPIYRDHAFHPLLTLSTVTDRALGAVMTVAYDRDDAAETERAARCYRALWEDLTGAGYLPYRAGIQSMPALATGSRSFWDTVRRLKRALDPQSIIAPGRYDPLHFSED